MLCKKFPGSSIGKRAVRIVRPRSMMRSSVLLHRKLTDRLSAPFLLILHVRLLSDAASSSGSDFDASSHISWQSRSSSLRLRASSSRTRCTPAVPSLISPPSWRWWVGPSLRRSSCGWSESSAGTSQPPSHRSHQASTRGVRVPSRRRSASPL